MNLPDEILQKEFDFISYNIAAHHDRGIEKIELLLHPTYARWYRSKSNSAFCLRAFGKTGDPLVHFQRWIECTVIISLVEGWLFRHDNKWCRCKPEFPEG